MRKNFIYYVVCWFALLALFNVICFVVPTQIAGTVKYDANFWVGYTFITLSFLGQLACAYFAFAGKNAQRTFYHLPLVTLSYVSLIISVIVGAFCMVIPGLPTWVGIILCFIVLTITVIAVFTAKAAAGEVERIDEKIKTQTHFIKTLTLDAQNLVNRAQSPEVKKECVRFYESARYSDPMSSPDLAYEESQIIEKIPGLAIAVASNNAGSAKAAVDELVMLIQERNA